jgi:aminomethyltransferase
MVGFAGYDMPVHYEQGILKEHLWTRESAGAFDVSHMGPAFLGLTRRSGDPEADHAAICALVEPLICGDLGRLRPGALRYTLLLNADGGAIDDLIIGRPADSAEQGSLFIVVNAGGKERDFSILQAAAGSNAQLTRADDGALIAVQGPNAEAVIAAIAPGAASLAFMTWGRAAIDGASVCVSRSGYTGEDGFEILAPKALAVSLWDRLLTDTRVRPIGLGARDSLRLEAGLPLYGQDLDETVSPFEAGLGFAVAKRRLKLGDLPGAARLAREAAGELARVRIGLKVLCGAPAREGAPVLDASGQLVGRVTSGAFAPSLGFPVAMAFAPPNLAAPGTLLSVKVRDKVQPAEVVALPFFPHRYRRPA